MNWLKIFSLVLFSFFVTGQTCFDIVKPKRWDKRIYEFKRNFGHERYVSKLHHAVEKLLGADGEEDYSKIWGDKPV